MRKKALCFAAVLWCCWQPGWAQVVSNVSPSASIAAKANLVPQAIILTRTAAAPFGAEGSVELQSSNSAAGNQLVMTIEIQALTPGKYRIEYAEVSNGVWRELGFIAIRDPGAIPDLQAGDSGHEDSTTHQSEGIKSRIAMALPADLAPTKIRYMRLTDLGGTVLLEGKGK